MRWAISIRRTTSSSLMTGSTYETLEPVISEDGLERLVGRADSMGVEDLEFLGSGWIADDQAHHEPVELGLGQRVGALVLDRVLCGNDHERRRELAGDAVDGDLALFHGLEERSLRLGAGPVDLVTEGNVGEHRPGPKHKGTAFPIPHRHTRNVGGQQIRGELNPLEVAVDGTGQRFGQDRLAHTRHVFDEHMALGEQAEHDEINDRPLALDDLFDVAGNSLELIREPGELVRFDLRLGHGWAPPGRWVFCWVRLSA